MPLFLRRFLSIFILDREKRHQFVDSWGKTRNFGKNNRIIYVESDGTEREVSPSSKVPGLSLIFRGDNNVLRLHTPFHFEYCEMTLGYDCLVEFQPTRRIARANFCITQKGTLRIGKGFSCMAGLRIAGFDEENLTVTIGDDCMFSGDIFMRPSDGHTLLDAQTKQVINFGKDIHIGNHVWCGMQAGFLKGAQVADDCVVGANSIVTHAFTKPNMILAGAPARELPNKRPVTWDRRTITDYLSNKSQK